MSAPSCLEWALKYAARGRRVFPVHAFRDGKCTCGKECSSPAKHPFEGTSGLKEATTDPDRIRAWWKKHPFANVAIATGEASDLVVLDVDPAHGGEDSIVALREDLGDLPKTFVVKTGGGGWHSYFRYPGEEVRNSAGRLGPGLDIRGDGGYVVAPPSNHASGGEYSWAEAAEEMAVFPEMLLQVLRKPPYVPPAPAAEAGPRPAVMTGAGLPYGLRGLQAECAAVTSAPPGTRNVTLNRAAFSVGQLVAGGELDDAAASSALLAAALGCGLGEAEARRTIQSGMAGGARFPRHGEYGKGGPPRPVPAAAAPLPAAAAVATAVPPAAAGPPPATPVEERKPLYTDLGNSWRFVKDHGEDLRHAGALGWLVWDGRRWKPEERDEVLERAKVTAGSFWSLVPWEAPDEERKKVMVWALSSQKANSIKNMMALAKSDPRVAAAAGDFDRDEWALNCWNGILELRTGELRRHTKADLVTKVCPVEYDPAAKAPRWEAFLARIFPEAEMREFLQRLVGYALTGSTREQVVAVLWGTGDNGKSVLTETLKEVLGDYAKTTTFDTFLVRKSQGPRDDIAALAGARLVTASEPEVGARLAEGVVKQLTGSETVAARKLYKDLFEFRPVFKPFLVCNHKPRIVGTDRGIWRRILLVPFTEVIPEAEKDKDLPKRLRGELPGILRWALEGCLWWQREGLRVPAKVQAAITEYREEEDALIGFLDDCCVQEHKATVPVADLRHQYERWCHEEGIEPVKANLFGRMLTDRGFEGDKDHASTRIRRGLRLRQDWLPKASEDDLWKGRR